jgi:hypothetical protein
MKSSPLIIYFGGDRFQKSGRAIRQPRTGGAPRQFTYTLESLENPPGLPTKHILYVAFIVNIIVNATVTPGPSWNPKSSTLKLRFQRVTANVAILLAPPAFSTSISCRSVVASLGTVMTTVWLFPA